MATLKISSDLEKVIKKVVLDTYFPIGSLYLTVGSENPNNTIGGTWVRFGNGKTLVGVDTNDSDFNSVEKTGGSKTHRHLSPLTWIQKNGQYAVGVTNDLGSISGAYRDFYGNWTNTVNVPRTDLSWEKLAYYTTNDSSLQPYITIYIWKRTA